MRLTPLPFSALAGWQEDATRDAFAAFRRSALRMVQRPYRSKALGIDGAALADIAAGALAMDSADDEAARAFFEAAFQPMEIAGAEAFLTGYYEPIVAGSPVRTSRFRIPLMARPADLIDITDANRPLHLDAGYAFARATRDGLMPYFTRAEIEDGALAGRGLELCWLEDPVEAYFIHVQGSCRVHLTDGRTLRLAYDGKAGHPYTSIGRRLVERGVATAETMTADVLTAWLRADPVAGRALMRENDSYVFFKVLEPGDPALGAVAAADVALTPGRSLAVDHRLHTFGTPIWIEADLPQAADGHVAPFRRLMVAQDTGSAIVGPARGDIFVGSGDAAGRIAGLIRHAPRRFVIFAPRPERD